MAVEIYINGVNRTSVIKRGSIEKTDNLNERVDTLSFVINNKQGFIPQLNDDVKLYLNGNSNPAEFGGIIVDIKQSTDSLLVEYDIKCSDYSFLLGSKLVNQRFEDMLAGNVIKDIIDTYSQGFTYDNVEDGILLKSVAFDRVPVNEALQRIANLINYSWYVDAEKDIHFIAKNDEEAPYSLSDTNGNYIWGSLKLDESLDQVRNRVIVRGGLAPAETTRTETFTATGSDPTERTLFRLGFKFDTITSITVDSVEQTVGVEYLNDDEDYNCMWSYQEKYIRFTDGNIPDENDIVEVTGIPLFPVIVQVSDNSSIAEYSRPGFDGIFEHLIKDDSITSSIEASQRASAELEAYANALVEGSFNTYTPGLRSGQTITIQSTIRGINEEYIIQSVTFRARTDDSYIYTVKVATLKTVGIINVLRDLLRKRLVTELEGAILLTLLEFLDFTSASDEVISVTTTTGPYYIWPNVGDGISPPAIVNFSTISDNGS
jgi:hypothetical protein